MLSFCTHLSFLLNLFILYICICSIYKVLVLDVFLVLLLQLIASVVLICKSLRIKSVC